MAYSPGFRDVPPGLWNLRTMIDIRLNALRLLRATRAAFHSVAWIKCALKIEQSRVWIPGAKRPPTFSAQPDSSLPFLCVERSVCQDVISHPSHRELFDLVTVRGQTSHIIITSQQLLVPILLAK
jgi:hypothetical protein